MRGANVDLPGTTSLASMTSLYSMKPKPFMSLISVISPVPWVAKWASTSALVAAVVGLLVSDAHHSRKKSDSIWMVVIVVSLVSVPRAGCVQQRSKSIQSGGTGAPIHWRAGHQGVSIPLRGRFPR